MNDIINKFLLAGGKFMPEMHLKQPGFTYSVCGPFTKNKERIKKFMETGNTDFIYKNELDKACFQHDMAYGKAKDLVRRTQSDKVLRDKAFKMQVIQNTMAIREAQLLWFINVLTKNLVEAVLMSQIINWQMNFISLLLKNLKEEKYIHHSETIFGEQIQVICNH